MSNYKKYIILFIAITFRCLGFSQNIYFVNKSKKIVYITKTTLLGQGGFPYSIENDEKKVQCIPLQTQDAVLYNVTMAEDNGTWGTNNGNYYLFKPNDTIFLINKNERLHLTHKSSRERNRELAMGEELISEINVKPVYKLDYKKIFALYDPNFSLKKRDRIIDSLSDPIINFIDKYCTINHIDPTIGKLYKYNFMAMRYDFKLLLKRPSDISYKKKIEDYYKDSVSKWAKLFNCNLCSNVPVYNSAAKKTFDLLYKNLTPTEHLNAIAANTTGDTKSFLLSSYINDLIETNSKGSDELLTLYYKLCTNNVYKKIIADNHLLSSFDQHKNSLATLMGRDKKQYGFEEVLKKYRGKVIYIDFWASWCPPCLEEIPFSIKLEHSIKKDENIKIVYISVDRDFNSWINMEKTQKLAGSNSFILLNYGRDGLSNKLDLNTVPRYIIIGKDGKLINSNASRPSEAKTYLSLSSLAKK